MPCGHCHLVPQQELSVSKSNVEGVDILRMCGTICGEYPWVVMPDLCFYRVSEEIEKEQQATAEKP